ncbi:MAG: hypothetical protein P1P85_02220 [Patescibacteria group bacterium]|nr:hypothetical protein [Patescibacteria group bacterium]
MSNGGLLMSLMEINYIEAVGIIATIIFIIFMLTIICFTESFWLTVVGGIGTIFIPFGKVAEWQYKRINNL